MAIGFPAYHEQTFPTPDSHRDAIFRKVFGALGWTMEESDGEARWKAKVGANLMSWGERVIVQEASTGEGLMQVRSECRLSTQCFDWGKNRRNVVEFMAALKTALKE